LIKCLHIHQLFSKEYKPFIRIALFVLLFIAFGNRYTFSQGLAQKNIPTAEFIEQKKDSLRLVLLENKQIVEDYEASILAALMYYPDLKTTNIQFRNSRITTSMAALPNGGNIFRAHKNRKYTILINNRVNSNRAPLISEVPFTARVGIIGHELAHIVDYKTKSNYRLMFEGLAYYFNTGFKRKLEHKVDRIAIYRGLGEGIIAFRIYIDNESNATEKYKLFKQKIYLSSTDIEGIINEYFATNPSATEVNNNNFDIGI
jgi:hypothetical protein